MLEARGPGRMQEARRTKKQDSPQIDEVHMKGMNSVSPEACIFPNRMLNSLTQYLIFDVQTACSLCYKLVYSLTSPPASLGRFFVFLGFFFFFFFFRALGITVSELLRLMFGRVLCIPTK